jgi:hypothetical protein
MKVYLLVLVALTVFSSIAISATAHCDFNNDGFDDVAITKLYFITGNPDDASGQIDIRYGSASGLTSNNQLWINDVPPIGTQFDALSCGDFNGDGFSDLAIGHQNAGNVLESGVVIILNGTSNGLDLKNETIWSQASPGIEGAPEAGDHFGAALASGDFNGDGYSDLAVGIPGESLGNFPNAGAVEMIYGSSSGLTATGSKFWSQDSDGIGEMAQENDHFGAALVAADFGKDTASGCYDDLAIGVPNELYKGFRSGIVHTLYGSANAISAAGSQLWYPTKPGMPTSTPQKGDQFGGALAAGTFRATTSTCGKKKIADLIIGAPGAGDSTDHRPGATFVVYGNNWGLGVANSQMWTQNSAGMAGDGTDGGFFGGTLTAGHTVAGHDYLVIGAWQKDKNTGAVYLLYTDPKTHRLSTAASKFYNEDTPGIQDFAEQGHEFGEALATGDINADGEDDLEIGAPLTSDIGGSVHILYEAGTSHVDYLTSARRYGFVLAR